jgi:predicted transcriptional regulator of viral defense system
MSSTAAGISQSSRAELARVVRGRRFVTPSDAGAALGIDKRRAARKLARWAGSGWLRRVRRGLYIPVPVDVEHPDVWSEDALVVASAVWEPCYFTGWTSANHWGLTEQTFRTVVLKTAARVRTSSQEILGSRYLINHSVPAQMDWGMSTVWLEDVRIQMADPARTVIDCFDAPRLGGGIRHCADILSTYMAERDTGTLIEYGDRLGNRAVFKRIGYVLDQIGFGDRSLARASLDRVSAGISMLDPSGPPGGTRDAKWSLRVNGYIALDDAS